MPPRLGENQEKGHGTTASNSDQTRARSTSAALATSAALGGQFDVCSTGAITLEPFRLDLGLCIFCGECADVCPQQKIEFTRD